MAQIVKNKPMSAAVDCDDVLVPCMENAIDYCNKKYDLDLKLDDITSWLPCGSQVDVILECFNDPEFYKAQVPYPGAEDFIKELQKLLDVYILTAVPVTAMTIRGMLVKKFFPTIPDDHIILTTGKNVVDVDILFDDGAHNILSTRAKYPVIRRRPWNKHLTGMLAVNTYDEFLQLVKQIQNRYNEKPFDKTRPGVIGVVGPSGAGKTTIVDEAILRYSDVFAKPISYTTRTKRDSESETAYHFISKDEFEVLKESGEIFESTIYSENKYGSSKSEVQSILDSGKNVILPLDMCGAIGMKSTFENSTIVYVDRHKRDLLTALLSRNCSVEDKVNRIISMPAEERNAELCDYIIENNGTVDDALRELMEIIGK